jgi:phenylpropionate dioxygenase-like ring-hydroxylating dioxygenase large terminal subunit
MHLIKNLWYPILESNEVKAQKPLGVERLGLNIVLWRNSQGQIFCHRDQCPHLGAALSQGTICNDRLICPFHGFEFDSTGTCKHIPANGRQAKIPVGMEVLAFEVREAHGFIWLWWGDSLDHYPEIPFFQELLGWNYGTSVVDWPVHYTRAIENQLDVAHLPFVHRTTIGAGGRNFVDGPYVESNQSEIKVWVHNSQDQGQTHRSQAELSEVSKNTVPSLHFIYPGIWKLNIGSKFQNFIAFVPINEKQTRYYLRAYFPIKNPLLAKLVCSLSGLSNRYILNQDKKVVITQKPLNSLDASQERLIGADRAISTYRRRLEHALREGETPLPSLSDELPFQSL